VSTNCTPSTGEARNPVDRCQYQILWLLASGKKTEEVGSATGYSVQWIRKLARRYNSMGVEGVGDRRKNNPGGQPLLDEIQFETIEELEEVVLERLKVLIKQPEFIHGLTCFHW
jgi:transposase